MKESFKNSFQVTLMNFYHLICVSIKEVSVVNMLFLSLIEKWKKTLNNKHYAGTFLMELPKAFDTINHQLLIAKLYAYGILKGALN